MHPILSPHDLSEGDSICSTLWLRKPRGRHRDIAPACPRVRSARRTAQAPSAQAPHTFLAGCEGWMLLALLRGSLMFMIALRAEAAFYNISFKPLTISTFPWEEKESQRVRITRLRSQSRQGWIQNSKANYGSKSGALSLLPLLGGCFWKPSAPKHPEEPGGGFQSWKSTPAPKSIPDLTVHIDVRILKG